MNGVGVGLGLVAVILVAIFLWGGGLSSVARSLPHVGAGSASAGFVLRSARASIARAWLST